MELSVYERKALRPQTGWQDEKVRPIDLSNSSVSDPFWGKALKQIVFPCSAGVIYDELHNFRVLARCGKYTCDYCSELRKRVVQAEIQHLREVHKGIALFTVLTFYHGEGRVWNGRTGNLLSDDSVKAYVRRFCSEAAKITGTRAYFKGWEPHKDGSPHVNIMWFGVKRNFTSCNILDKRTGKYDIRKACLMCEACQLRSIWEDISGAPRSTHVRVTGKAASYVTKYISKWKDDGFYDRFRRYGFSQACKRSPNIVPVYQYISNWLKNNKLWKFGYPDKNLTKGYDYWTPFNVFTGKDTEYMGVKNLNVDGYTRHREVCSEVHDSLCDPVPYWSPTRVRAWGGLDSVWDWFGGMFGKDTELMVTNKIKNNFEKYREVLV